MKRLLALALALSLGGCAVAGGAHPEASLYDTSADATKAFADARARSTASGKPLLAVLGANWCHDSRALAGWLETPRFRNLVANGFEIVFVDVGRPQSGEGRNMAVPAAFGFATLASTPALLIVAPDGTLLNRETATTWGNAASRSEDAIYAYLARFAAHSPLR